MKRVKTTTLKQYNRNPKESMLEKRERERERETLVRRNITHLVVEQSVESHPPPQQVYPLVHVEQ